MRPNRTEWYVFDGKWTKQIGSTEVNYSIEFYRKFLADESAKEKNATSSSMSFAEQIKKLSEGVELLSTELQTQVRQQHGALLSQASHAGKLTAALEIVNGHMARLEAGAERLKTQINTPYAMLESQTRVLARLHDASHLLRQAGRFLQLFRKLQANAKDTATQASILYELEPLLEDEQLKQVDFVQDELAKANVIRQRLNNLARRDLTNALKSGKHEDKPKAIRSLQVRQSYSSYCLRSYWKTYVHIGFLQIFANLQTLSKCVDDLLDSFITDIRHSIKECFLGTDVANLSSKKLSERSQQGPKISQPSSQNFRSKLWAALDWLFDEEITSYCSQIIMLESCLALVSQSSSGTLLSSMKNNDVVARFWASLEDLLLTSFSTCQVHISSHLKRDLPKLLISAHSIHVKFGQRFTIHDDVFSPLDSGYLEKCVTNLKEPMLNLDIPHQVRYTIDMREI